MRVYVKTFNEFIVGTGKNKVTSRIITYFEYSIVGPMRFICWTTVQSVGRFFQAIKCNHLKMYVPNVYWSDIRHSTSDLVLLHYNIPEMYHERIFYTGRFIRYLLVGWIISKLCGSVFVLYRNITNFKWWWVMRETDTELSTACNVQNRVFLLHRVCNTRFEWKKL